MTQHPDRAEMIERLTQQVRTEDGLLDALVQRKRYSGAEAMEAVCAIALRENEAMVREVLRRLEERERRLGVAGSAGNAIRAAIANRGET